MTLQLAKPDIDAAARCGRVAGLEMPGLVLSILAATLTGDDSHV